ncbi:MAG: hypothetical protein ACRDSN_11550 [Pseudonocardiaceae bacterium]
MSYCDIRGAIPPPTLGLTEAQHDAAVCAVLRWAKRTTGADAADAGHVCAVLGLDLSGALQRARGTQC